MDIAVVSETVAGLLAASGAKEPGEAADGSVMAANAERVKEVFGPDARSADALDRTRRGEPAAVADLASALAWYAGRDQGFADELASWATRAGSAGANTPRVHADGDASSSGVRQMLIAVGVGVAANLITGLVIALALLLDHYYRISQDRLIGPWVSVSDLPSPIRWMFAPPLWLAYVLALLAGGVIIWWQAKRPKPSLVWLGFALGLSGSTVLALIGYASGVK